MTADKTVQTSPVLQAEEVVTNSNVPKAEETSSCKNVPEFRYDLRVLQALRQIIRAVDLHSRKLLGKYKITGPQLIALLAIAEHQPLTVKAIAEYIHLSPSTTSVRLF